MNIYQISFTQQIPKNWNLFQKDIRILSWYLVLTFNTESMIMNLLVMTGWKLLMTTSTSYALWDIMLLEDFVWLVLYIPVPLQQLNLPSHTLQLKTSIYLLNTTLPCFLTSKIRQYGTIGIIMPWQIPAPSILRIYSKNTMLHQPMMNWPYSRKNKSTCTQFLLKYS